MNYWTLVEPIWEKVSIYDGTSTFLQQYAEAPEVARTLLAAHWANSEIRNGGFIQFFTNRTGVLAPEAVQSFHSIGMPQIAKTMARAMDFFGPTYPRARTARQKALKIGRDKDPAAVRNWFEPLDDAFFAAIDSENGGFEAMADRYAAKAAC